MLQAQKAREREEDEHFVDKLDSDFALLAQTPALLSLTESAKMNANKNNSSIVHKGSSGLTGKEVFNKVCVHVQCLFTYFVNKHKIIHFTHLSVEK